jgi:SAM-dependent methyltransferase
MGNEFMGSAGHSAEYFGDTREFWYASDFVALLSQRWRLHEVETALDVGCGVGHWGRLLATKMSSGARVVGIDREQAWVEAARDRAAATGLHERFEYRQGTVESLPFEADSFDLVTCQTVLIHVQDPCAALQEMIRVTRPGGMVAVAEPNNVARALLSPDVLADPIDEVVALVQFQLTCERGKEALGEGNNSIGELVPRLFHSLGLEHIHLCQNDKASPLIPPYDDREARANVDELRAFSERDFWIWSRADTHRYFLAGGGQETAFETFWSLALAQQKRTATAIDQGTFSATGGNVVYLVSGRKPSLPSS